MRQIYVILIFIFTVFLLFYRLGETTLTNWDEAWLASVAQDIAARGDWFGGQWNGQTWFYEPPLVTWSLAVLYKIFGPSEFWLRSLNAVFGLLIIIIVYNLSALITKSAKSAYVSVIILLSNIEFLFRSRQINVEIPVTFFLVFTIYAILKAGQSPKRNWWIAAGISLGLAFLTKRASPILIFPAITYSLLKTKNRKNYFIIFITFISITLPWFFISYLKWGNQFLNEFFLGYTLGKIRSVNPGTGADIWFYITALRHAFKLWFPLIPFTLVWAAIKSFRDRKIAALTIFILSFLIFLTAAPIKSSWFLLPVHPAIAVIIGLFIDSIIRQRPGLALQGRALLNQIIFIIIIIAAWQIWHYRRDFIVPDTTGHQAIMAKLAGQLTPSQNPIYLDDDYLPAAVFYSRRRVIPLRFNRLQPITPLPIPSGSYILTNSQTLPILQNNYPGILLVKEPADLMLFQTY